MKIWKIFCVFLLALHTMAQADTLPQVQPLGFKGPLYKGMSWQEVLRVKPDSTDAFTTHTSTALRSDSAKGIIQFGESGPCNSCYIEMVFVRDSLQSFEITTDGSAGRLDYWDWFEKTAKALQKETSRYSKVKDKKGWDVETWVQPQITWIRKSLEVEVSGDFYVELIVQFK